jgi:hypothetical protein
MTSPAFIHLGSIHHIIAPACRGRRAPIVFVKGQDNMADCFPTAAKQKKQAAPAI